MSDIESAYHLLRTTAAALSASKGLVWVNGPDAVVFLDSLLSQNIAAMRSETTARSLLLAPNGKLRATLVVLRGDERIGLICDVGAVDAVVGVIVDRVDAHLAEEVAEGDLTQEEADERLATAEERAAEKVAAAPGEGGPQGARGGRRGPAETPADA